MDKKESIVLEKHELLATITLNRPEVGNAMNLQMIREISSTIEVLKRDERIRLILFKSEGAHFCSGADLNWMQAGIKLSKDQLESESLELAKLFRSIRDSSAVSVCSVKGRISGGGIGLLAASDFVIAESSAVLTFPEVKLGLIPATIAPYVLRKAGLSRSSDWMMTGRLITASEARDAGLIHRVCEEAKLKESTKLLTEELLSGGIQALKGVKHILRKLEGLNDPDEVDRYTSGLIAGFRISSEGQEGMKAKLEKRKPMWDEGN